MPLTPGSIRPKHIQELIRALAHKKSARGKKPLAPRSVRSIWGTMHAMFEDAVADEFIEVNPCKLKKHERPQKIDADPTWRAGAVFSREEVVELLTNDAIPDDRRMMYGLMALAGVRFGEAAALKWEHYDATLQPLGRLLIAHSYSTDKLRVKATKTERTREVPVHPALVTLLTDWRMRGWKEQMRREPQPHDLIVPSRKGVHRNANLGMKRFGHALR